MSDTGPEFCRNCRHWHPAWRFKRKSLASRDVKTPMENLSAPGTDPAKRQSERGQCRRYAPRASALTTVWMETNGTDWCGEFVPLNGECETAS